MEVSSGNEDGADESWLRCWPSSPIAHFSSASSCCPSLALQLLCFPWSLVPPLISESAHVFYIPIICNVLLISSLSSASFLHFLLLLVHSSCAFYSFISTVSGSFSFFFLYIHYYCGSLIICFPFGLLSALPLIPFH